MNHSGPPAPPAGSGPPFARPAIPHAAARTARSTPSAPIPALRSHSRAVRSAVSPLEPSGSSRITKSFSVPCPFANRMAPIVASALPSWSPAPGDRWSVRPGLVPGGDQVGDPVRGGHAQQPSLHAAPTGRARQHLPCRPACHHKLLVQGRVQPGEPAGIRGGERLGNLIVVLLRVGVRHFWRLPGRP